MLKPTDGGFEITLAGRSIGRVVLADGPPPAITCVTLEDGATRAGLGMEAVRLVVHGLRATDATGVEAIADPANGLSVYFWLRLGFRPVPGGASPMRFTRDL